ncbi:hypothetical protein [Janthinobacterium sp. PC23-8]|uniref:hypothetical protein n=1 Tax=Janthinobacterium sp. PC23-8 TaxID=2012679 RepID=UPI0011402F8B|nr:hypothetical protein [Janthinobacterium sp. PC23-8]
MKLTLAATVLSLSACAGFSTAPGLDAGQTVSLVNSLTWVNPMSGKRDGVRTSWPIKHGKVAAEYYPLAQLKRCDAQQKQCAWGVMRAQRSAPSFTYADGGVNMTFALAIDVARRQEVRQSEVQTAMAIPQDVAALAGTQQLQHTIGLKYGKVEQMELDFGVRYQVCAQRLDAAGKAIDQCDIPFI